MTTTMQNFNIKRFANITALSIIEERGFCLKLTLALSAIISVLAFSTMLGFAATDTAMPTRINTWNARMAMAGLPSAFIVFMIIYPLVISVGGSLMFRNMSTKQQRIAYLMLPASNLEKFLSRVLLVLGGGTAMFLVSLLAADVVQQVGIRLITGHSGHSFLPTLWEGTCRLIETYAPSAGQISSSEAFDMGYQSAINMAIVEPNPDIPKAGSALLWIFLDFASALSFFVLCGSLFRRLAWAIALFGSAILSLVMDGLCDLGFWASLSAYAISIVAMWWAAYKLFCRTQVITHKNLNL